MHNAASPTDHQRRVILLRHGQTEWSKSGQHTGRTDIPLTDEGIAQAASAAALVAALELVDPTVIASPRQRAVRTAELAGLTVDEQTEDLGEWDYGEYEGLTTAEIRETVPGWTVWTHPCPGGESAARVQARADRILARARDALEGGDVVLVGHGHFSRALLARWVGMDASAGIHLGMSPAGLAVLGQEHGRDQIVAMNITPALP